MMKCFDLLMTFEREHLSACFIESSDVEETMFVSILSKSSTAFCDCISKCVSRCTMKKEAKDDQYTNLPVWLIDLVDNLVVMVTRYKKESSVRHTIHTGNMQFIQAENLERFHLLITEVEATTTRAVTDYISLVADQAQRSAVPEDCTVLSLTSGVRDSHCCNYVRHWSTCGGHLTLDLLWSACYLMDSQHSSVRCHDNQFYKQIIYWTPYLRGLILDRERLSRHPLVTYSLLIICST